MEWTWQITYVQPSPIDSVAAATLEADEIDYELLDAQGAIVWAAPLAQVRSVTRGAAVIAPETPTTPSKEAS